MKKVNFEKIYFPGILATIAIIGLGAFIFWSRDGKTLSLEAYADEIIEKCAKDSARQECYNREIPELLETISMEDAFRVTALVQAKDRSFPYCHVLGHELASLETRKEPAAWKEVISRCPTGVCSNGCVHGAFQERFRNEVLVGEEFEEAKIELTNVCEAREGFNPTEIEQGSCYHALGHLLMYITGADIDKAVASCPEVSLKPDGRDFTGLCYDGAFMQIYQPLDTDDQALIRGKEQTPLTAPAFCARFNETSKASCWTESWPLFFDKVTSPEGVLEFCSYLEGKDREDCLIDIFYIIPGQVNFNEESIIDYCEGLPQDYRDKCFAQFVSRLLEIDSRNVNPAVAFCAKLKNEDQQNCFASLADFGGAVFGPSSVKLGELCESLPEDLKQRCYE